MIAWLDANCGSDGWISMPSSTRGVVNDALAIYFADVTLASAFVAPMRDPRPVGWYESFAPGLPATFHPRGFNLWDTIKRGMSVG
jgi:hypothetical protein